MHIFHLVSHTHWDREWYLPFQNFRLKLVHLVDNLLDLLATDPNYRYFMLDGQTIVLDDYLEIRPEREDDLCAYIQTGRILIGPWYILPDEFLVSPEALVRNLLQGARSARQFGARMDVGYIPDPFGHIGQMPQILQGFDIRQASVQRGLSEQPCEFWWQSPDGSKVFMGYLRDSYANAALLLNLQQDDFVAEVRRESNSLIPYAASSHVLLMQGNDHTEPSRSTSPNIDYAKNRLLPDQLVHSTLPAYLSAAESEILEQGKEIPIVFGELRDPRRHNLLPAVLSTRVWIKQRNHACETLLEKWAEPYSTFANQAAKDLEASQIPSERIRQPAEILRMAWRTLMTCHPHDSICGCSIDQVHREMQPRFDQVEQIGDEITQQSLALLAAGINTSPPEEITNPQAAIVVFNPNNWQRTDAVSIKLQIPNGSHLEILSADGQAVPHEIGETRISEVANLAMNREEFMVLLANVQEGKLSGMGAIEGMAIQDVSFQREGDAQIINVRLSESGEANEENLSQAMVQVMQILTDVTINQYVLHGSIHSTQVDFIARDVPPLGYRTYWVRSGLPIQAPKPNSRPVESIENEFYILQANPDDGTLVLTDKRTGIVTSGLNRFIDGGERGDEYNYCPPENDREIQGSVQSINYTVGETAQTVTVKLELLVPKGLTEDRSERSSQLVPLHILTHASLAPGISRVDIHTEVENPARDHRLRVHFPASFSLQEAGSQAAYDGHFEVVQRSASVSEYDDSWSEAPRPEMPQRAFCDICDGKTGLMVTNRGLREVEVQQNENGQAEIALTLLRCVGWLSRDDFSCRKVNAGPILPTPEAQMLGNWSFDYALIIHEGGWERAFQNGHDFNAPLRAAISNSHKGTLPPAGSFIETEPAEFVISAVKTSEDDNGWMVRGYNISTEPIEVKLKTWANPSYTERINLAETTLEKLHPDKDGAVTLTVKGKQIASVKFGWNDVEQK